jgi:hypothetical protein
VLCTWLLPSTFCKFKPEHEAFSDLATERLPEGDASFEARNISLSGAARYFEQINAFD